VNLGSLSLSDLAAFVSEHLRSSGIEVAVVGGSAISAWTPDVYTSLDIDFAVSKGVNLRLLKRRLSEIGFKESSRIYVHPECKYTLDFVATTPYIDERPIVEFAEIKTPFGSLHVYYPLDAIMDRAAHFVHWSDDEALRVAERCLRNLRSKIAVDDLERGLGELKVLDRPSKLRLELAQRRLRSALQP
jgi:hypothetical protein